MVNRLSVIYGGFCAEFDKPRQYQGLGKLPFRGLLDRLRQP
jgi:hypothetical protein